MKAYVICGECGDRVHLIERKDFESFTTREAYEHYQRLHPEKLTFVDGVDAVGMPYLSIRFEEDEPMGGWEPRS